MSSLAVMPPEPFELPSPSGKVWTFAIGVALALHVGMAGVILFETAQEPEENELGAPGLTIAIDLASPRSVPTNLPPGPESEASAASQAVAEQRPAMVEPDLPKQTPVESENPDQVVTLNDVKEPAEQEKPDVAVKEVSPTEESVAQEATARPSIETAVEAPQSTTVDPGTAASSQRARLTWQRELAAHLDRYKRYPGERLQRDVEAIVDLVLDRTGRVVSVSISQSSGYPAFDEAAMAWVKRASPVPVPPPLVADEGLVFKLPMRFQIGKRD